MSVFADRLIRERENAGLSQLSCSEKLGISRDTLSKWENDHRKPDIDELKRMCKLFDCDADYLLGNIDERSHDTRKMMNKTGLSETSIELLSRWNVAESPQVARVIDFLLSYRLTCVESGEHGTDFINRLNRFLISDAEEIKYSPIGKTLPPDENGIEWISDIFFDAISFDDAALTGLSGILRDMKKEWKKQNKAGGNDYVLHRKTNEFY